MKIDMKREENVSFGSLRAAAVFVITNGDYYIKVNDEYVDRTDNFNALNLSSGVMTRFEKKEQVKFSKCRLVRDE